LHDPNASVLKAEFLERLRFAILGFPPLIFDLERNRTPIMSLRFSRCADHWGAVAKSNFTGCRYREPVYRSLRELAMSYFNIYFNLRGERTLRRYSRL
jgi:hypothetical protein